MTTLEQESWASVLTRLIAHQDLSHAQVSWAMDQIMTGQTSEALIAAFLVGLQAKGESSEELGALAQGMISKAQRIEVTRDAVDIVGTGGDLQNTVNISTMASLVVAGAGVPVIKHGNRSSTSASGSADVLEKLGVNLQLPLDKVADSVEKAGITFLFAQVFHPSMRYVGPVRRSLGVPTVFNYLGPMTNPARVQSSAIGVANAKMAEKMVQVFASRGDHALVFRGHDGLDEITITGESTVWETQEGSYKKYTIRPADFGLTEGSLDDIRGGTPEHNAQVVLDILQGESGPIRTAVLLNAAAGLVAFEANPQVDLKERFTLALEQAKEAIDSGKALETLNRWINFSQS